MGGEFLSHTDEGLNRENRKKPKTQEGDAGSEHKGPGGGEWGDKRLEGIGAQSGERALDFETISSQNSIAKRKESQGAEIRWGRGCVGSEMQI